MNLRVPGEGRYAQLEREQRWALFEMPACAERLADIVDRYILGTRLRLRRVDSGGLATPAFAVRDVTKDDRLSGGALATASDEEVGILFRELAAAGGE